MNQPMLFDVAASTNCAIGLHAKTHDMPPVFHDDCVNVDHVCPLCDLIVGSTSYTRAEWDRVQAKHARS